ncbi:MAG: hypothetical protein LUQ37_02240 [Methanoregulaceae archaeon]|nr:hypothetical protein [Methanoregulaceae archaeon]
MTERTLPEFLRLPEALAWHKHLAPPDNAAQSRLKADLQQDTPRCEAYVGWPDDLPVGFVTCFFTYPPSLPDQLFISKISSYLNPAGAGAWGETL